MLITRPRRFGKTLFISTLESFLRIDLKNPGSTHTQETLFDGLNVSKDSEFCSEYMGQFPTVFVSFKDVYGQCFEDVQRLMAETIQGAFFPFRFLLESKELTAQERNLISAFVNLDFSLQAIPKGYLEKSLQMLVSALAKHFKKPAVLLIDEYDVPLAKASKKSYYDAVLNMLRQMLSQVLKPRDVSQEIVSQSYLKKAILTGCLRVSKESIFTGLNNPAINTVWSEDLSLSDSIGFTPMEVSQLLDYFGLTSRSEDVKLWYDGYKFAGKDIYCPWDVINFAKKLVSDPSARPSAFWINSSGNDMVKRFVDKADRTTRDEIEKLVAGGFVEKQLRLDLTYDEIDNTIDNLWSVLFTTGYLTKIGEVKVPDSESYAYKLVIPNKEVREVFILQIQEWFKAVVAKDDDTMKLLSRAILDKDEKQIARQLNIVMSRMISILDTKAPDAMKENFYHGLLLGLLRGSNPDWLIKSNRESGDGFSDILIMPEDPDAGIVIEVKYAKEMKELDAACEAAITQIKDKRYDETLRDEGRCDILAYGIAFCRKRCRVVGEKF